MFGGFLDKTPKQALIMGVVITLDAKELIMLATGSSTATATIVTKVFAGPITSMVSASAIKRHPNCKVVVDEVAAEYLQGREYYEFVFKNEPERANYR